MIRAPDLAVIGMPKGERASAYPEIEAEKLVGLGEANGTRMAWTRATDCPCVPINEQTEQPDMTCPLCRGKGVLYFGPEGYVTPSDVGELTDVQKAIVAVDGAAVIRGAVQRATQEADLYDQQGRWVWGGLLFTTRPENRLGYYDRLVALDSEMVFFETIVVPADAATVTTRYRATRVNLLRSVSTTYRCDTDFRLVAGVVTWLPDRAPDAETRLTIHYHTHPAFRVIDHPHALRETTRRRKLKKPRTPFGSPQSLPLQARIRLEFLPVPGDQP